MRCILLSTRDERTCSLIRDFGVLGDLGGFGFRPGFQALGFRVEALEGLMRFRVKAL